MRYVQGCSPSSQCLLLLTSHEACLVRSLVGSHAPMLGCILGDHVADRLQLCCMQSTGTQSCAGPCRTR